MGVFGHEHKWMVVIHFSTLNKRFFFAQNGHETLSVRLGIGYRKFRNKIDVSYLIILKPEFCNMSKYFNSQAKSIIMAGCLPLWVSKAANKQSNPGSTFGQIQSGPPRTRKVDSILLPNSRKVFRKIFNIKEIECSQEVDGKLLALNHRFVWIE